MKKLLHLSVSLLSVLFLLGACSENDLMLTENEKQQPKDYPVAKIRAENGYLNFTTPEIFDQTLNSLFEMDDEEINSWLNQFADFSSMYSMYAKTVDAEASFRKQLIAIAESNAQFDFQDESELHSELYFLNKDKLAHDGDGNFYMNTPIPELGILVNEHGLVKVGGHVLKYSYDSIEILGSRKGNLKNNISVREVEHSIDLLDLSARTSGSFSESERYWPGSGVDCRLTGKVDIVNYNDIIYGDPYYEEPDCLPYEDDPGCEGEWIYPIIDGLNYTSYYTVSAKNERHIYIFGIGYFGWKDSQADRMSIDFSFKANGRSEGGVIQNEGRVNLAQTVYRRDGLNSRVDFTDASNTFFARKDRGSTGFTISFN